MLIKNTRCKYFSDYSCFEYKNSEVENKAQNTGCLITTTVLIQKLVKLRMKFLVILNILLFKKINKLTEENFKVKAS